MSVVARGELAIVTGANRGLGLETCRQLAERGLSVVLTARDRERGERAAAELRGSGAEVRVMELDVANPESVRGFTEELARAVGQVDVLVNNAGISLSGFNEDVARRTLAVNFFGAADVTDHMLPLLRSGGRVVMVSSGLGSLASVAPDLRSRFSSPSLTRTELDALMHQFIADVAAKRHRERGWPNSAYGISKVGLNALTRIVARDLPSDGPRVNAIAPGWVRTDMGGRGAPRSLSEGAQGIVWAALLAPNGPTGGLFHDGVAREF